MSCSKERSDWGRNNRQCPKTCCRISPRAGERANESLARPLPPFSRHLALSFFFLHRATETRYSGSERLLTVTAKCFQFLFFMFPSLFSLVFSFFLFPVIFLLSPKSASVASNSLTVYTGKSHGIDHRWVIRQLTRPLCAETRYDP